MERIFICPKCRAALTISTDHYDCQNCRAQWPISAGVVKLSEKLSYWSLLPQELFQDFLAEAEAKGWREAIVSSNQQQVRELLTFTDSPSRADGSFYLSLTDESRVLDLGPGWGSYTFAISPRVKEIVAADTNNEALRFISLRARQSKISNITPALIEPLDYARLPFADNAFDAVIMNGVLEWVGAYLAQGDPLKIQSACLKETARVLKPGGEIWLGIENRFGLRYFYGAPDDHLLYYAPEKRLAYTTLMPRLLADLVTRQKLGRPYRTYTHSLWGLKRLLNRAGLDRLEFYYPEDDYRALSTRIIPVEAMEAKRQVGSKIKNQLVAGLVKTFDLEPALCDSYFVLGGKTK